MSTVTVAKKNTQLSRREAFMKMTFQELEDHKDFLLEKMSMHKDVPAELNDQLRDCEFALRTKF
jgi:hypothetical protein